VAVPAVSSVFFSSDTHFMHRLVAAHRQFATTGEHDQAIVDNWNALVKPGDLVWHLGDVGLGNELGVISCASHLNGRKQLVAGNHDPCWPGHRDSRKHQRRWLDVFESVQAFARIRIEGRAVLLSHFPYAGAGDHTEEERYPQYRLPDMAGWLAHGHVHSQDKVDGPRSVHVGLDAWDLRPVSEGQVAALIRGTEAAREAEREKLAREDPLRYGTYTYSITTVTDGEAAGEH
jgi:calcineurin-like phosphoesterase family protein